MVKRVSAMILYESRLWIEDIDKVIDVLPELDKMAGKSVLITGAAGLIGSAFTDLLIRYNETHPTPVHIFAAGRRREKMIRRFGRFCDAPYFDHVQYDALKSDNELPVFADYIIHGAGNAHPDVIMREPVETMLDSFTGMLCLLRYAKEHGTRRVLYISSSEIYGRRDGNGPCREDEYGYIDLQVPRSSYSVSKRAAETLCASYAAEYGVDVVTVRPGHIYGPTASPADSRVSSAWAYAAARGEDIVMKSDGGQLRSYCYCLDCASAMIKVLLHGENGCAYNISCPRSVITIRRMAELFAETGNVRLIREKASETEKRGFNPMQNSSLDSTKLEKLGWEGCFDVRKGVEHTVRILEEVLLNDGSRADLKMF